MLHKAGIPGGNYGMWIVGVVGLAGVVVAGALSFAPPNQITTGSPVIYVGILMALTAVEIAIPFIVYAFRKPSWKAPDSDFEPFDWETEGRRPGQVSKLARPPAPASARLPQAEAGQA
jgi:hypothetical protein